MIDVHIILVTNYGESPNMEFVIIYEISDSPKLTLRWFSDAVKQNKFARVRIMKGTLGPSSARDFIHKLGFFADDLWTEVRHPVTGEFMDTAEMSAREILADMERTS